MRDGTTIAFAGVQTLVAIIVYFYHCLSLIRHLVLELHVKSANKIIHGNVSANDCISLSISSKGHSDAYSELSDGIYTMPHKIFYTVVLKCKTKDYF